jgi:anion-transporting  ArsA/GET3 family ATPase
MMSEATKERSALDAIVANRKVIVCVGSGGVGKTTTSAALALRAACNGKRAIVLTVDPAKRLANALGMERMPNHPVELTLGAEVPGRMWALMLDARTTFDEVVRRHAPSEKARERILSNPFYAKATSMLAGTHEYMAMEQLLMLHESGDYDCLVLDTPPSAHAVNFLRAPRRLTAFMNQGTTRLFLKATKLMRTPFGLFGMRSVIARGMSIFVGSAFFGELLSFIESFEGMFDSFDTRARRAEMILCSDETGFLIIHAPEDNTVIEAEKFHALLQKEGMNIDAFLANQVHEPPQFRGEPAWAALEARLAEAAQKEAFEALEGAKQLRELHERLEFLALRDVDMMKRIETLAERHVPAVPLVRVPHFDEDLHDIEGLQRFAHSAACVSVSGRT